MMPLSEDPAWRGPLAGGVNVAAAPGADDRVIAGSPRAWDRYPDYMPSFQFEQWSIAYTEFGGGPAELTPEGARGRTAKSTAGSRPLILIHGLLLSQKMHRPLAMDLAA